MTQHSDKEKLIREAFELWTQIGYGKFHAEFFHDPEEIRRQPDPTLREQKLRKEWQQISKPYFEEFRAEKAPLSARELAQQVDQLRTHSNRSWDYFQRLLGLPHQPPPHADDPMVQELLTGLHELVSAPYVDSLFPADGLAFRADDNPTLDGEPLGDDPQYAKPFAALSRNQKWDVIESYIDWDHFRERGLDYLDQERIASNVRRGLPTDQWLDGTSYRPSTQPTTDPPSHPIDDVTAALLDQLFSDAPPQPEPQPEPSPTHQRHHKR